MRIWSRGEGGAEGAEGEQGGRGRRGVEAGKRLRWNVTRASAVMSPVIRFRFRFLVDAAGDRTSVEGSGLGSDDVDRTHHRPPILPIQCNPSAPPYVHLLFSSKNNPQPSNGT